MGVALLDANAGVGVADLALLIFGRLRDAVRRLRRIEIAELVRGTLGDGRGNRRGKQGEEGGRAKQGRQAEAVRLAVLKALHDDALFFG